MNLKKVMASEISKRILISVLLILILFFISFFAVKKRYYQTLFFPASSANKLLAEKREFNWKKTERERITNLVEEILIGTMNKRALSHSNQNSKLVNLLIENDRVILNLNNESLDFIIYSNVNNYPNQLYEFIYSITNSICFNFRSIKHVKFYFNGILYEYLDTNFQGENGFSPNWKLLY